MIQPLVMGEEWSSANHFWNFPRQKKVFCVWSKMQILRVFFYFMGQNCGWTIVRETNNVHSWNYCGNYKSTSKLSFCDVGYLFNSYGLKVKRDSVSNHNFWNEVCSYSCLVSCRKEIWILNIIHVGRITWRMWNIAQ